MDALADSNRSDVLGRGMNIPDEIIDQLADFLLDHEADIAQCFEDFGDLQEVFRVTLGREAMLPDYLFNKPVDNL